MSYAREPRSLNAVRLGLWLLNVPVGLLAFFTALGTLAGAGNPYAPDVIAYFCLLQPVIACVAWAASHHLRRDESRKSANLLLLVPLGSILAAIGLTHLSIWGPS